MKYSYISNRFPWVSILLSFHKYDLTNLKIMTFLLEYICRSIPLSFSGHTEQISISFLSNYMSVHSLKYHFWGRSYFLIFHPKVNDHSSYQQHYASSSLLERQTEFSNRDEPSTFFPGVEINGPGPTLMMPTGRTG